MAKKFELKERHTRETIYPVTKAECILDLDDKLAGITGGEVLTTDEKKAVKFAEVLKSGYDQIPSEDGEKHVKLAAKNVLELNTKEWGKVILNQKEQIIDFVKLDDSEEWVVNSVTENINGIELPNASRGKAGIAGVNLGNLADYAKTTGFIKPDISWTALNAVDGLKLIAARNRITDKGEEPNGSVDVITIPNAGNGNNGCMSIENYNIVQSFKTPYKQGIIIPESIRFQSYTAPQGYKTLKLYNSSYYFSDTDGYELLQKTINTELPPLTKYSPGIPSPEDKKIIDDTNSLITGLNYLYDHNLDKNEDNNAYVEIPSNIKFEEPTYTDTSATISLTEDAVTIYRGQADSSGYGAWNFDEAANIEKRVTINSATTSTAGLMSSSDKKLINKINEIGVIDTASIIKHNSTDKFYLTADVYRINNEGNLVSAGSQTGFFHIDMASTSNSGLMSAADKKAVEYLKGIEIYDDVDDIDVSKSLVVLDWSQIPGGTTVKLTGYIPGTYVRFIVKNNKDNRLDIKFTVDGNTILNLKDAFFGETMHEEFAIYPNSVAEFIITNIDDTSITIAEIRDCSFI